MKRYTVNGMVYQCDGKNVYTFDGALIFGTKDVAEVWKRYNKNSARQARDQAYRDCGMVKVRGALGGTYYE